MDQLCRLDIRRALNKVLINQFVLFLGVDASLLEVLQLNSDILTGDVVHDEDPFWQPGKMSYHCPRCNAGYTYKRTLMTHMKYDCGKLPRFKCPYCNKRDKCSSNIYKHVRIRHGGLPVTVIKD